MPTIHQINRSDTPSPFSNHILVEPVNGGFQASGVSMADRQSRHLNTVVHHSYDEALREATTWSIEHNIPEIFVIAADGDRA